MSQGCWEPGPDRLVQLRVATNLQFVKMGGKSGICKARHSELPYNEAGLDGPPTIRGRVFPGVAFAETRAQREHASSAEPRLRPPAEVEGHGGTRLLALVGSPVRGALKKSQHTPHAFFEK